MLQSWDKLLSAPGAASTSTEIHLDALTVELLYNQAESDFVQSQTKMRAFAYRICSEFKRIERNWNRIVHQNALGVWSSLQPDHNTNKSPRRMQVSPPAEER